MTDRLVTARVEVIQWMSPEGELRWDIDYDDSTPLTQIIGMLALAQMEMYRRALEPDDA
jgi:hypothetical protein